LPRGLVFGRVIGIALIAGAVMVSARPEIAQSLAGKM